MAGRGPIHQAIDDVEATTNRLYSKYLEPYVPPELRGGDLVALGGEITPAADIRDLTQFSQSGGEHLRHGEILPAIRDTGLALSALASVALPFSVGGIMAGKGAKTADIVKLNKAQDMLDAGHDMRKIYDETGWFVGKDGKWRFEIPDLESNWHKAPEVAVPPVEGRPPVTRTLGEALDHPDLYEAYPHLRDIPFSDTTKAGSGTYYPPDAIQGEQIAVGNDVAPRMLRGNVDETRSTTLHEAQHAVQRFENFARGGSPASMAAELGPLVSLEDIDTTHIWPIMKKYNIKFRPDEPFRFLDQIYNQAVQHGATTSELSLIYRQQSDLEKLAQIRARSQLSPNEAYQRLAGEVEARNVETRRDLSPTDLRRLPPPTTESVPRAQQIVRYHDNPTSKVVLPDDVTEAFTKLGELQRGDPERAMLDLQSAMGGGVLNPVAEHVGDLSHRMSHLSKYGSAGANMVAEKTWRTLRALRHPYGFEREMMNNIRNNATYRGVSEDLLRSQVDDALARYSKEHSKLPVYNRPQWLAREAAVAVGDKRWHTAERYLQELDDLVKDPSKFEAAALAFERAPDGSLKQFPSGGR